MDILVPITMKSAANAISNANCRIPRIIRSLNATGARRDLLPSMSVSVSENITIILMWLTKDICIMYYILKSSHERCTCGSLDSHRIGHHSTVISIGSIINYSVYIITDRYSSIIISLSICIWNQARSPAELKHITKRRKRNQRRLPQ